MNLKDTQNTQQMKTHITAAGIKKKEKKLGLKPMIPDGLNYGLVNLT